MDGKIRREKIITEFESADTAIAAKTLADKYDVSRQVIVQDIALLRALGYNILSTHRGYILNNKSGCTCVIKVHHSNEQLGDELTCIVDLGGQVEKVMVNHRIYGKIEVDLKISSRRDVREFLDDIKNGRSTPLMNVTSNYHFHLIKAPNGQVLDEIIGDLSKKGYLIEVMDGKELR